MGVRIQELPETTGINKEDVLIVEDGQGTKKGTVQQLDESLGVSQLKEDLSDFSLMNNSTDRHIKIVGSFWCGDLEGDNQVGQKLIIKQFEPMNAIKLIPVMKGDKIKLSCVSYGISKVYYIVDNDMTILSHGTDSFNGILDITDENSKFLAVTQFTGSSFNFECYLISHNVEMIYNVEEKIDNTNQTDKMIEKDGKFYTTDSEKNLVGEKITEKSYDKMKTYYPIRVFKGDKYRLSTKSYGTAKSYYITDKDNTILEIGGETYDSILKIEQENAYYLYVNYFKESGYDFHLCLVTQDFLYSTNYNEDKKVSFFGDSITAGTGTTICYHMYLAQKYGWHCYNYGIGGTGFVVRNNTPELSGEGREGIGTSEVITVGNNNFLDRVSQLPTDSDMIVVLGGVNDWLNSVALETFRTNVTGVMDYLQTNRTNASVICLLPLKSSWKTTNSLNLTLQDYIDVIKEICMAKSIITVDLNNKSNINPWNDVCKTELIPDGLHPNEKGHKRLFNLIKTLCCDLIN